MQTPMTCFADRFLEVHRVERHDFLNFRERLAGQQSDVRFGFIRHPAFLALGYP